MAESGSGRPVCAVEALALLNCTAEPELDRDKCLRFLDALRKCVLDQKVKKFSLSEEKDSSVDSSDKVKQ